MTPERNQVVIFQCPKDLRLELKLQAVRDGTSMGGLLRRLVHEHLTEIGVLKRKKAPKVKTAVSSNQETVR